MQPGIPHSQTAPTLLDTSRTDGWWIRPFVSALGLFVFIGYSCWAAFQGDHYQWGPYLSPFYTPLIIVDWWPFSPAFLIIWAPAGFRITCYYQRQTYYRSLLLSPPACSVGGVRKNYRGERFLQLFQNLHRYFLYLALLLCVVLGYDAVSAFGFHEGFGIGVGTVVLNLNFVFLTAFTCGCDSLRHLVGGNVDCYSCAKNGKQRYRAWKFVSLFNIHHNQWAWISLFWVGFADLYIRLVSMGIVTDLRII